MDKTGDLQVKTCAHSEHETQLHVHMKAHADLTQTPKCRQMSDVFLLHRLSHVVHTLSHHTSFPPCPCPSPPRLSRTPYTLPPPSLPPPFLLLPASPAQGANGELKLLSRDEIAASFEQDHANTIIDSGSPASASHLAAPTSCHHPSKCIVNGHIDRSCRAWASEAIVIAGTSA